VRGPKEIRGASRFLCTVFLSEGVIDDAPGNLERHVDETEELLVTRAGFDNQNHFRHAMFKAVRGSEIAAFAELYTDSSSPRRATLQNLAVAAQHRRLGLGRLLVEEAAATVLAEWEPNAYSRLYVNVEDDNEPAQRFYERIGFVVGDGAGAADFGFGSVMMSRALI